MHNGLHFDYKEYNSTNHITEHDDKTNTEMRYVTRYYAPSLPQIAQSLRCHDVDSPFP